MNIVSFQPMIYESIAPLLSIARDKRWAKESRQFLADNPHCVVCGTTDYCVVHHVKPFHLFPELEMDWRYWRTVCETPSHNDHFAVGHLFNWSRYNQEFDELAKRIKDLLNLAKQ